MYELLLNVVYVTHSGTPMGLAADGDDASSIKSYSSIVSIT